MVQTKNGIKCNILIKMKTNKKTDQFSEEFPILDRSVCNRLLKIKKYCMVHSSFIYVFMIYITRGYLCYICTHTVTGLFFSLH
jgi:hypothetical protein